MYIAEWRSVLSTCNYPCYRKSELVQKEKEKNLKNVKFKKDATDYTAPGSLDISYRADNFLSRTVDRQAKPKDSGGSGGSSTHVSSSGTTHGGSSGKF